MGHIIFHAFSKAMIFISTRLVLHTFNSSQDSRKISNFINFSINSFKLFFVLFAYSAVMTILYSINLILWVFNFRSNTILPIILTYNGKIFNLLLILLILLVLISFNLFILNFNFSLFNSFIGKFLPIILLAFILPKVLNFNFNHLSFNIFNISNFHLKLTNKF